MEYKSTHAYSKVVDDRIVEGLAAVFGNVDSGGDRIVKGAFKKTIQENKRVRHLWQHDSALPPVAVVRDLREATKRELPAEIREANPDVTGGLIVVREYLDTPRGNEILEGIKSGAINEMSFGYDPIKFDFEELAETEQKGLLVRNLRELRLWDTSDVNWGMNPLTVAVKSAVPYRDTGTADEGAEWSAPNLGDFTDTAWGDLSDGEKRRIAAHFAWSVSMPPESYGDLKLPHHQASKEGVGPAVWRGCAAAMGAMMGSRGGVDLPEGDRRGVYNHLARHYAQYDKEPPEFKLIELAAIVSDLRQPDAFKDGLILPQRGMDALAVLQEILQAAEPSEEIIPMTLTAGILSKLAIYERDPILTVR